MNNGEQVGDGEGFGQEDGGAGQASLEAIEWAETAVQHQDGQAGQLGIAGLVAQQIGALKTGKMARSQSSRSRSGGRVGNGDEKWTPSA
ncbi:hypothetical protein [Thermogemmatispora carboxidivorans]|uniref:hypothetical protein n=1 Tax=Thermogemmatispora carboxidivorans TaxID=1382306 RepID=UPI000699827A|nr:hypothetical protein [Thermogemmatispora carboxidivorans]